MANPHGYRLVRNSVFTLFNTVFTMATTWLISIWVARQLGPDKRGVFGQILWLSGTVSWVVGLGLTHAITKFVAEADSKGDRAMLSAVMRFALKLEIFLTGVSTIALLVFATNIADFYFSPNESFYFVLSFLGLLPGVITSILCASVEGIQKFEYFVYANLIVTPLSFLSKVVVLWMGLDIMGLLSVMLVFSFVNMAFYGFIIRKEGLLRGPRQKPIVGLRTRIFKYIASVWAILLCDKIVWDRSENAILGRLWTASEVAFYDMSFNITRRFTSILPETLWRVLFPAMSSYFGSGDRSKMKRVFFVTTRYLAFFTFPVGVAGMILSYQLLHYLYGHDYINAQRPLQVLFVASIFSSLSNPAAAILYGFEKQAFIYRYGLILAVVNIGLDLVLIRTYGALGAAICFAITTVLASVGGLIYTCRTMKLRYPFVSVFKILFATVMMGIVMQLVLIRDKEIAGSLISLASGTVVYLVCALVLGTFEREDYALLDIVKTVLPGPAKKPIDWVVEFIAQFKENKPDVNGEDDTGVD